jgi:hypothetical protein
VLRALLEQRGSVVPLRFGAVLDGTDALENDVLEPNQERLESLLAEFEGLVELQLRALYLDEEAILHDLVLSDRELVRLRERSRSGGYMAQVELGEATLAAFEHRRAADGALLHDRLSGFARDSSAKEELPERVAAQLAFLVERGRQDALAHAAERLAKETSGRLVLRLVGPLPPYSFVAFELEGAGAR